MKKIIAFLCLASCALAQQSVTLLPNGTGGGTLNTPGITYYYMGPYTYDFTGSTVLGISGGGGGGNVIKFGTPTLNQLAGWTNATTIQGITLGTNLSITGTTLNASGGAGGPRHPRRASIRQRGSLWKHLQWSRWSLLVFGVLSAFWLTRKT